jgi:hypothetical protein
MAVIMTATSWTQVVESRVIEGKHKRNRVKLTLAVTGANTYPSSGGIPLPTDLGMTRNIDYVIITQPLTPSTVEAGAVNSYLHHYNQALHSVHLYEPLVSTADPSVGFREVPTTFIVSTVYGAAIPAMYIEVVGW